MAWSLLIRNGTVVDGSGAPARAADVAVEGDRIAAVGPGLAGEAARVIDAKGLMVAPGFIDIHSHSDLVYDKCPSAESKVRQGVTTEVVGMCSFSPAPVAPGRADLVQEWAGGIGGKIPITWNTFGEYLDHVRSLGPSVNIVQFVGHGALRLAAVGPAARPATPDEQKGMERLLAEGLDAGAFGFSTGLVYAPSVYGNTEELVSLARSMASRRGLYFSHIRGEAATLEQAAEEAISIGEQGGVPVQIAHVKASGRENWGKMDRVLRMIDGARARGVDVTGDVYPYPAGSTKMDNLLPAWMHDGGISKLLERLIDPKARQRAIADCLVDGERWRTGSGGMGWDEIMIATCSKPELAGIHLAELARRTGKEPAQAMMDLVMEERAGVSMIVFSQSEDNVAARRARAASRQAPPAQLRDVPARARGLLPREAALLLGDRGAQDDRHGRDQARPQGPRAGAGRTRRRSRAVRSGHRARRGHVPGSASPSGGHPVRDRQRPGRGRRPPLPRGAGRPGAHPSVAHAGAAVG